MYIHNIYLVDLYFKPEFVLCLKVRPLTCYAANILHYISLSHYSHQLKPISGPFYCCGYKKILGE